MGIYKKGILGGFTGTIGTVVGSTWNGIDYMKSKPRKSSKQASQLQLETRAKFAMISRFSTLISPLLQLGFKDAKSMTGINSAFSYNYNNAIEGNYPQYSIGYSKLLVTKGQLHNAVNPVVTAGAAGMLNIAWEDNSGSAMANASDTCIVLAYCPELKKALYTTSAATRSAAAAVFNAAIFSGKTVETWISFVTADNSNVASSFYTGQVVVS